MAVEVTPEIGPALREARIRRGIELSEVERVIKIRTRYLRAMEEDQWGLLPGPAYARAFLATYAHFLGLDHEALVGEYRRLHRPVEDAGPIPEEMLPKRGVVRRRPIGTTAAALAGLLAATGIGVAIVLGLTGGSGNEGDRAGRAPNAKGVEAPPTTTTDTAQLPARESRLSLWLRSTGTVWVCLMDDRGRPLVNGETLTADEARGPFDADTFRVTFGNGSVEMVVDHEAVEIPDAAEPLGYEITGRGLSELAPSERPTCL
jgi:cytoskeleton protein RodZ